MGEQEFDTLNGFLISLIGKIPADHERFRLEHQGWEFQVSAVRDKMIHTVKVMRISQEEEDDSNK